MIYSEILRLKYNNKTKAGIFLLLLYMVLITILLTKAIPKMVELYAGVGLVYEIQDFLFLWFGYHRFISISAFRLLFFATRLFPFIFLPLLLSWFGADTYVADRVNHCASLLYLRGSGKKYFAGKLIVVIAASFLITLLLLVFQLVLSIVASVYLQQRGIAVPGFKTSDFLVIISSCIKIPLFFSSITAAGYAITLFVNISVLPFVMPVILAVGSSVLIAKITNNIPMDLAFYDSGLMTPHMEIYWFSVELFLLTAIVLTWMKIYMTKDLLGDH